MLDLLNHVTRLSPVRHQPTAASQWPICWQLVSFDLKISSWSFRWRYLPFLQLRGNTLYVFFVKECLTMCSEGKEMCKVVLRQRERQKSNRFVKQNNFARASRFFCLFLCRHCTTTTWKCLISCFMEDVNKRQRIFFLLFLNWNTVPKKSNPKNSSTFDGFS